MVRIKHRYLLVQILYPKTSTTPGQSHLASANPSQAYLTTLHAPTKDAITAVLLLRHVRAHLTQLFGDAGAALAGSNLSVKYWSNATSTFVLRCKREAVRWVWAAVTFIRSLPVPGPGKGTGPPAGVAKDECVMKVSRVSGTMRKVEEAVIADARRMLGRVKGVEEVARQGLGVEDADEGDGAEHEQMDVDGEDLGEAMDPE